MVRRKNLDDRRWMILKDAGTVRDRIGAIAAMLEGKRVLNVGCTGARPDSTPGEEALQRHTRIANAGSDCLGLDLDAEGVEELNRRGYEAVVADACTCDLGERFEFIVAGEIIEHVADPGALLRNMAQHLEPGGTLAVSTPNPFCTMWTWKILKYGHPCVHPEHTAWYDPVTLMEMSGRNGLTPQRLLWVQERRGLDLRFLPRLLRHHFSEGFILVLNSVDDVD